MVYIVISRDTSCEVVYFHDNCVKIEVEVNESFHPEESVIVPIEPNFQNVRPEAEGFIQSALDTLPEHIAILDHSLEIIGVNAAWRQLTADNSPPVPDHGMGMKYPALCQEFARMDLPQPSLLLKGLSELAAGEREMFEIEYKRGERRFFVVRARRFRWHEDLRLIVAHENITELKHAQIQLDQELDRRAMKQRCLSMMSHELRAPLASIQLSRDMLAQYSLRTTADERQRFLENISLQVRQLNEIVSDVVRLSKSERSEVEFAAARHDLVAFCRDIVESFQLCRQGRHKLHFHCDADHMPAEFDAKLLRRALRNLLGNAIKYSPAGGDVRLQLWRDGDWARISVSDEGIGIPEEDSECLFFAFHRASNVGSLPGSGLGLAIAKQALDFHRGQISFRSEIGVGTTFELALPLRQTGDTWYAQGALLG